MLKFTIRLFARRQSVYIPTSGNASKAASVLADCVHHQLQNKPDTLIFLLGDFNHCKMGLYSSRIPEIRQRLNTEKQNTEQMLWHY